MRCGGVTFGLTILLYSLAHRIGTDTSELSLSPGKAYLMKGSQDICMGLLSRITSYRFSKRTPCCCESRVGTGWKEKASIVP